MLEGHRRGLGDPQWVPLSMREGRVMMPYEDRASRLEREVEELKTSLDRLQAHPPQPQNGTTYQKDVPPAPSGHSGELSASDFVGLRGHDFCGVARGSHRVGVGHQDPWVSLAS